MRCLSHLIPVPSAASPTKTLSAARRIRFALRGLCVALARGELAGHLAAGVGVVAAGVFLCLGVLQWIALIVAIALVLVAETFNTALEELANVVTVRPHGGIQRAKDVSAGAVLLAAVAAGLLGLFAIVPALLTGQAGSCLFRATLGTV